MLHTFYLVFCTWRLLGLWAMWWGFSPLPGMGFHWKPPLCFWLLSPAWTSPIYSVSKLLLLFSRLPAWAWAPTQGGAGPGTHTLWRLGVRNGIPCVLRAPHADRTLEHLLGSGAEFTLDPGTKHVLTQTQTFKNPWRSPVSHELEWQAPGKGLTSPDPAQADALLIGQGLVGGGAQPAGSALRHLCLP